MKDWKSTAAGVLAFLIATFTVVTAFLAPYLLTAPSSSQALIAKIAAGVTLATALARAWVGLISLDPAAPPTVSVTSTPSVSPAAATKVVALMLVAGLGCTMLGGCTDWERGSFQTLSASQAVINQAQTDYEARTIAKTPAAYAIITEAKAGQTLAVQAMETYEEIKAAKGSQTALEAQQAIVTVALERLPVLIAAVKGLAPPKA